LPESELQDVEWEKKFFSYLPPATVKAPPKEELDITDIVAMKNVTQKKQPRKEQIILRQVYPDVLPQ
jgi:hypothetical protein